LSFLIQTSSDQRLFAGFPRLIAGYHVFRRLSMPRHPPCTLSSLTTFIDHRHDQRSEKSEARSEKEKIPSPPHRAPTANHSDLPQGSGKRYERPIMGQINTRRASNLLITPIPHQVLPAAGQRRLAPVHTPKRCSTIFRPRQKRPRHPRGV
jgi:hypothetical protein